MNPYGALQIVSMMSNGGDMHARGLGYIGALSLPPSPQGARFSLGVELDGQSLIGDFTANVPGVIQKAIQDSGYTRNVQVKHVSGYFNPYISVEGQAAYAHGSGSDLQDVLLGIISQVYTYEPSSVKFAIEAVPNTSPSASPTGSGYPVVYSDADPNREKDFLEKIADSFGINRTQATILGAFGALAIVLVISRR